jgi:hypothetical protein
VAVTAVDSETRDMVLMAKRDGLRLVNPGIRDVGRALEFHENPAQPGNDKDGAKDGGTRERIRAAMKNLHRCLLSSSGESKSVRPEYPSLQVRRSQNVVTPRTKTGDYSSRGRIPCHLSSSHQKKYSVNCFPGKAIVSFFNNSLW